MTNRRNQLDGARDCALMRTLPQNSWAPAREEFHKTVSAAIAFKRLDLQNADDVKWLRRWMATALGYVLVCSSRLMGERTLIEGFRSYCYASRQPLIVLRLMLKRCELFIDLSPTGRDMTAEESAAIGSLMKIYAQKSDWTGGLLIRRYRYLTFDHAAPVAREAYKILTGQAR
jgi:hypothetical protein